MDYSVVIPAYNEEVWLARSLPALREAMGSVDSSGEMIVVDNNSTDRTAAVASEHGATVVFEPVRQISRARNAGARVARGKYLIFVDADTILSGELLRAALANLAGGACCGGGVRIVFDRPLPGYVQWITNLWNRLALKYGLAAGCFVFCLREAFDAAGGFSERVFASEELWFSRGISRWGRDRGMEFRILADPPIVTSSRKLDHPVRNLLGMLFLILFPPGIYFRRLSYVWYGRDSRTP